MPVHANGSQAHKVFDRLHQVLKDDVGGNEDKDADVIHRAAIKCGFSLDDSKPLSIIDALSPVYREAVLPLRKRAVHRGLSFFRKMGDKVVVVFGGGDGSWVHEHTHR